MPHILSFRLLPAVLANFVAVLTLLYTSTSYIKAHFVSISLASSSRSAKHLNLLSRDLGLGQMVMMDSTQIEHDVQRGEVYFVSHGGPPSMYDTASEPYQAWKSFGRAVEASDPKGMIVVSAHWEHPSGSSGVQINNDSSNPLIYDFYGFPPHYYQETFKSRGDLDLLMGTMEALKKGGVEVEETPRGLDHGVWVPLKVAFDGKTDIPLIQVSLPGDSDPESTMKLGQALSSMRDKGYAIIGSGQVVHNLRDALGGRPTPYSGPFLNSSNSAIQSANPKIDSVNLFKHPLYKRAHPTPEHLLPLLIPVGAADERDRVEEIFVGLDKMGMGWGMWKWTPREVS